MGSCGWRFPPAGQIGQVDSADELLVPGPFGQFPTFPQTMGHLCNEDSPCRRPTCPRLGPGGGSRRSRGDAAGKPDADGSWMTVLGTWVTWLRCAGGPVAGFVRHGSGNTATACATTGRCPFSRWTAGSSMTCLGNCAGRTFPLVVRGSGAVGSPSHCAGVCGWAEASTTGPRKGSPRCCRC